MVRIFFKKCMAPLFHSISKGLRRDRKLSALDIFSRFHPPKDKYSHLYILIVGIFLRLQFPRSSATFHSESQVEHHLTLALRGLESTQHQVRALANLVKEQSQQIKRLEQMTEKYAPYVWKITGFQEVYDRAVTGEQETILSEPFYLSKNGYKLRIKMLPNGGSADPKVHKDFKGKYMSVYIKVIPGEYDSILSWPVTEKIRITMIDQVTCQSDRVNVSKVVDFQKTNWTRLVREEDVGFGFVDFVHQNVLQTRSYLKNDKIFIMVSKS